ncbi:hypothetical protein CQ14_35830 [Bradyrhizobium lablabi]|uniref:Uncharacterized protein n=1 Tax=Bradyrhizobium lablabi TaxID=722472 RepID=A0A0R3N1X5_9BRAD|nr:hypothetical protein [Bradyrhizobium lablabi]KRR24303.1 hypothetical protein CQ14_35830 [Bradyrhizobium lablabi]
MPDLKGLGDELSDKSSRVSCEGRAAKKALPGHKVDKHVWVVSNRGAGRCIQSPGTGRKLAEKRKVDLAPVVGPEAEATRSAAVEFCLVAAVNVFADYRDESYSMEPTDLVNSHQAEILLLGVTILCRLRCSPRSRDRVTSERTL